MVGELVAEVPAFGGEEASKIIAPLLLMHGTGSPRVLHAIVDRLGKSIPNSEISSVLGAAHFSALGKTSGIQRPRSGLSRQASIELSIDR